MNLTVNDLSYTYRGGHTALQNVSFTARQGELLSVLGPNGAGKSTLFRCILGGLPDYGAPFCWTGGTPGRWNSGRWRRISPTSLRYTAPPLATPCWIRR